jgi:DNA gyrase inhibitor GyrI
MSVSISPSTRVDRPAVTVAYLKTADTPEDISAAWEALEHRLDNVLKGRKFFGVFFPSRSEYHVTVQLRDDDPGEAERLGLETEVVPGGPYLRVRLHGDPPAVYDEIKPIFASLEAAPDTDDERPRIEHYRRRDEIDLLVPVG